jgi:hypothetical protein
MNRLMTASAAPTPAAQKATVETVAVVWAESMSPHEEGGQLLFRQWPFAELVEERDIAPVTAPTPIPAAARPTPPHRSQGTADAAPPPSALGSEGDDASASGAEGEEGNARVTDTVWPSVTSTS